MNATENLVLHQAELLPCRKLPFTEEASEAGEMIHAVPCPPNPVICADLMATSDTYAKSTEKNMYYFHAVIYHSLITTFVTIIYFKSFQNKYSQFASSSEILFRLLFVTLATLSLKK